MNKIREINRVIPGTSLSVIEEFEPGKNTFVIDGDVRSSVIGKPVVNMVDRILNVAQKNSPLIPTIGDIVVGYIDMLFGNMISVRVVYINDNNPILDFLLLHLLVSLIWEITTILDGVKEVIRESLFLK